MWDQSENGRSLVYCAGGMKHLISFCGLPVRDQDTVLSATVLVKITASKAAAPVLADLDRLFSVKGPLRVSLLTCSLNFMPYSSSARFAWYGAESSDLYSCSEFLSCSTGMRSMKARIWIRLKRNSTRHASAWTSSLATR